MRRDEYGFEVDAPPPVTRKSLRRATGQMHDGVLVDGQGQVVSGWRGDPARNDQFLKGKRVPGLGGGGYHNRVRGGG